MKAFVKRLNTPSAQKKMIEWGKLITVTGSAQLLIQGIGLVSGILIIRLLSPGEYALYTLANTMLGTMVVLADGGISTGIMSEGGKIWTDKEKLGVVIGTGLHLRRKLAIGSLLIALPVLFYLLQHHGTDWKVSGLIILALIPAFFTSLSNSLLEILPRLTQNIIPLQKIQVGTNVTRLILVCLTLVIFPWAFVAVLAAGLSQLWAGKQLVKLSGNYATINTHPDAAVKRRIVAIAKRTLPSAIYYCFLGQITVWLISIFGTTSSIANVGALGRIAILLTIFTMLCNTLVVPRFARLPGNKSLLLQRFLQIQVTLLLLSVFTVAVFYLFSTEALWVLGPNYSNLNTELVLSIVAGCLGLISGVSFSLSTSRGWIINPAYSIPASLVAIIVGIVLIDVSTLKGILYFNIFISLIHVLIFVVYGLIKIHNSKYEIIPE
jgi:O-antigen/teichoic acid export membrane protein